MNKPANARLSQRIAEEAQLLAEEKWMIEALKKLKEQRNCLQIERLHLENLKSQLLSRLNSSNKKGETSPTDIAAEILSLGSSQPSSSFTHPPTQPVGNQEPVREIPGVAVSLPGVSMADFTVPVAGIDDEMCNTEQLNLSLSNSVFTNQDTGAFDMEEEEEDMENCVIDMNMFMYGK